MNINKLIQIYTNSNLLLDSIYNINIKAHSRSYTNTSEGVCGFLIPIKGKATHKINDKVYKLKPGIILHAGPLMKLEKYVHDEEWEYILIHYKILNLDEYKEYLESIVYTVQLSEFNQKKIMPLVIKLLKLEKSLEKSAQLYQKIILYKLILYILQIKKENEIKNQEDKISYVAKYVNEHINEINKISDLSEMVGMDEKEFYYKFKKKYGLSPKKYILSIVIKKAKELILGTQLSISEISYKLGYEDPLYFSRLFKKHTGNSPSKFREIWKKSI